MNIKTLETKDRYEPNGTSEALINTWGEQVWPDLPKGSSNYQFGGNETQINPSCEQRGSKPCNSIFFLIFVFYLGALKK